MQLIRSLASEARQLLRTTVRSYPTRLAAFIALAQLVAVSSTVQAQCDQPFPARLPIRLLLDGPFDEVAGLMTDSLRVAGLIPTSEPYSVLGYTFRSGGGGEVIDPMVLAVEGSDAIVDWVVVEVRDPNDPGKCILSRSALIQRDGDVMDLDGLNDVGLCIPAGFYHIAVRHRNHLGIMTGRPVEFFSGQFGSVYAELVDLSSPEVPTFREDQARKQVGARMAIWSGDVNFDGRVKYTGPDNDRDMVLQSIGGSVPTNVEVDVYTQPDVNLDSRVKYTGEGNDRDHILQSVGGSVPTTIREGYIPKDSLTLRPNVHIVDTLAWVLDTALSNMDDQSQLVFQVYTDMEGIDTGHVVVGADHGQMLDEATVELMAQKGIWWSLQPFVEDGHSPWPEGSPNRTKQLSMYAGTDHAYTLAKRHRIKTAWGTDILFSAANARRQNEKLTGMTRWFTPAEVLRMATSVNAELLALSGLRSPYTGRLGVVEEGALADLLLVDGDPLEHIELLNDPAKNLLLILKDGRVVKNTLGTAPALP